MSNLTQLAMALEAYHGKHGNYPPAYVTDADGEPLYSWRVLILPYIERPDLYDQYHLDEPWDSEHNLEIAHQAIPMFTCPSYGGFMHDPEHGDAALTNYVAVVGPSSVFRGREPTGRDDISDDPASTIFLVEVADDHAVPWAAPGDITAEEFVVDLADHEVHNHPDGTVVVFADTTSRVLPPDTSPTTLKAMTTIAAGDVVPEFDD